MRWGTSFPWAHLEVYLYVIMSFAESFQRIPKSTSLLPFYLSKGSSVTVLGYCQQGNGLSAVPHRRNGLYVPYNPAGKLCCRGEFTENNKRLESKYIIISYKVDEVIRHTGDIESSQTFFIYRFLQCKENEI